MGENKDCKFKISSQNKHSVNARGRPKVQKMILFSEQPQSLVSQILSRVKYDKKSIGIKSDLKELLQENLVQYKNNDLFKMTKESNEESKQSKTPKTYTCDFSGCSYTCKLSSNLIKHKRVHTDEKPYLCDRCSFRSNFINSLKVHKRIHTSERPYMCKNCNYKCNSSSNLKKHCLHRHPEV